jgi:hypothetical protein
MPTSRTWQSLGRRRPETKVICSGNRCQIYFVDRPFGFACAYSQEYIARFFEPLTRTKQKPPQVGDLSERLGTHDSKRFLWFN